MGKMPVPGGERTKICTREYIPVGGGKAYKRKAFGNATNANAAGYSVVQEGKC